METWSCCNCVQWTVSKHGLSFASVMKTLQIINHIWLFMLLDKQLFFPCLCDNRHSWLFRVTRLHKHACASEVSGCAHRCMHARTPDCRSDTCMHTYVHTAELTHTCGSFGKLSHVRILRVPFLPQQPPTHKSPSNSPHESHELSTSLQFMEIKIDLSFSCSTNLAVSFWCLLH